MADKGLFTFKITKKANGEKLARNLTKGCKSAQAKMEVQIINDSNYYCPLKTGVMQKSAITNTVIGSGRIVWKAPYVRKQYYGVNLDHSKSQNPNACAKWFETAKAKKLKQWIELFKQSL